MRPYVVLLRAGRSAAVGLVVLLGGPRRWRHRAAAAGFPDAASWRAGAWLATPLGLLLAIFWIDLVLAGLMGVLMPALWALEGDGELWYQWVVVDDLAGAFFAVPV